MGKLRNLTFKLKTLVSSSQRSSAGSNAIPWRLALQALPRYLRRDGYAFNPLSLFIIINGHCNMKCRMCDVGQDESSSMFHQNMLGQGDFDFDRYAQLMEDVSSFRPFISITSTEPLIYPKIQDAVAVTKGLGMGMNVTTNGYNLERHAEGFVKSGLDTITISLDGPAEIHNKVRATSDGYERALKGIEKLHDLKKKLAAEKPRILINSTICDLNMDHVERFLDHLPWDKIDRVGLMPMVFLTESISRQHNEKFGEKYPSSPTCLAGGVSLDSMDPLKIYESVKRAKRKYRSRLHLYYQNEKDWLTTYFREPEVFLGSHDCLFPWFAAQISAGGDILGLTRCFATSFGNVFKTNFSEAWNGPQVRDFRKDLQKYGSFSACSRCEGVLAH